MKIHTTISLDDDIYLNQEIKELIKNKQLSQYINNLLRTSFNIKKEINKEKEQINEELTKLRVQLTNLEQQKEIIEKKEAEEQKEKDKIKWTYIE